MERRLDWAEGRDRKAAAADKRFHSIADGIPLGQPILVGHHSERHARRDVARIDSALHQAHESAKMADHHRAKAAGIERQLETSIFSDDPDAIERLQEKLQALEAQRARMKEVNKEVRKGPGWSDRLTLTHDEKADLMRSARFAGSDGYPPYAIANLGGNIRRVKERIKDLTRRQAREWESAEQEPDGPAVGTAAREPPFEKVPEGPAPSP